MSLSRSALRRSNSSLVEARAADHLGQQRQAVVELRAERREPGAGAVPRRLAADLDAEALGRLGEGGRVEALRAGDEQLGGQRRDAGLRLVLARRAGIGQEVDADELAVGQRHEPDGQPVGQRRGG